MYSKEKRKVKIKFMILTALILFLPITVKASYIYINEGGVQTNNGNQGTGWYNATNISDFWTVQNINTQGVDNITFYWDGMKTLTTGTYYLAVQLTFQEDLTNTTNSKAFTATFSYGTDFNLGSICEVNEYNNNANNGVWNSYVLKCKNERELQATGIRLYGKIKGIRLFDYIATEEDLGTINTTIIQQTTQDNTNWNNFVNQDTQGTQTNIDDTGVQSVEQQGQQQITGIEQALQNIQQPTFDLTDYGTTFYWIWQTITYLFTTHTILMTTMIIVLSMGFLKTVLGR